MFTAEVLMGRRELADTDLPVLFVKWTKKILRVYAITVT
jgi:hypothetical protein